MTAHYLKTILQLPAPLGAPGKEGEMDSLLCLENLKSPGWVSVDLLAPSTVGTRRGVGITNLCASSSNKDPIEDIKIGAG